MNRLEFFLSMFFLSFIILFQNLLLAQGKPEKCIMIFGSHADDLEQMAGGTFAKYLADGYKGIYVCVMNNLSGNRIEKVPGNWNFSKEEKTFGLSPSPKMYQVGALETRQVRTEEALSAAKIYGATPVFLDFCEPEIWLGRKLVIYGTDEFIMYNPPGRKQVSLATRYNKDVNFVAELLKKYKPEITITHTLGGEKLDHGESAYLVYLAFKQVISDGVPVGKLWMRVRGWLEDDYSQNNGRGKPDVNINIKDFIKTKYTALGKHVSQKGALDAEKIAEEKIKNNDIYERFITVIDNTK